MNSQQIAAVRRSFALLVPQVDEVASSFYTRLFELDPSLRSLFKSDLAQQRGKLMAMLGAGVSGLDDLEGLAPTLRQLGSRHASYGVRDAHYETVRAALLDTLARGLGNGFTSDIRAAWNAAYALIAESMKAGAASEAINADGSDSICIP